MVMNQSSSEQPSSEQIEQALSVVANACAWSRLPASDTVSPLQQMQSVQSALHVVAAALRRPAADPPPAYSRTVPAENEAGADKADAKRVLST